MSKASRKKLFQRQNKSSSEVSISQALVDICERVFPHEKPQENDIEKLISLAVIAWNMANSSEEKRKELLKNFIDSVPNMKAELDADMAKIEKSGDIPEDEISIGSRTLQVLSAMVAAKNKHYPKDKRIIIDYAINGYNIQVSSIEPNEESATAKVAM
jgi:hypothetical protein